ncbi:MAG TPA: amidohydrolase family protein [Phycisphaerales bacterium]|nr:amidohydrolase family protein [Phycisphaerales bacterium]
MNTNTFFRLMPRCLAALMPLFTSTTLAQDLGVKAPPQTRPVFIHNATIHTVSGETIEAGGIVFDDGVITAVLPAGMTPGFAPGSNPIEIDAEGLHVYPGLVAPYTQIGLTEIQAVRATLDFREVGTIAPEVRAAVAINPDSTLLPVTRSSGILTAGVFPGTTYEIFGDAGPRGLIPGRASVIRLDGWTWEDLAILDDAGLVVNFPLTRPVVAWWMDEPPEGQSENIQRAMAALDDAFRNAAAYRDARAARPDHATDLRYEAMQGALPSAGSGQLPTFFIAHDVDQITGALAFAERHALRPVIVGARDADRCTDQLKAAGAAVVIESSYRMPKRDDSPYDELFTLPQRLEAAGIPWCFASGEETAHERNLPYAAAMAVAYGLSPDTALRAVTLSPAEILGVGDRLGSLDAGKSATLIVTDGHPLEATTRVHLAFIDGRAIDLENKHTALARKYLEKYRQLGLIEAK